jgi:hypothetical protein
MTLRLDTVFILGAGFSRDAGMPLQREILSSVRSLDLLVPPRDVQAKYIEAYALVQEFMNHFFELVSEPTLEDVFTFLDDSIARRQHCLGFKWKDLAEVHSSLVQLIAVCFLDRQARIPAPERASYERVAAGMLGQLCDCPRSVVLSLNWDCVAERSLSAVVDSGRGIAVRCCPAATPLDKADEREAWSLDNGPGLSVLKLHGSIDWFLCPECGRLFTGSALGEEELCRYSLPGADFAVRNLLKRSIGRHVPVSVVLTEGDDYHPNTPKALRSAFPAERYRRFFGDSERLRFHLGGLRAYFLGAE